MGLRVSLAKVPVYPDREPPPVIVYQKEKKNLSLRKLLASEDNEPSPIPDEVAAIVSQDVPDWALARLPDEILGDLEVAAVLRRQCDLLPAREKSVVLAYIQDGATFVSISKEMGRSVERVRQIFEKGLSRLRRPVCSIPIREALGLREPVRDAPPPIDWDEVLKRKYAEQQRKPPIQQYREPIGPMPPPITFPEVLPEKYVRILRIIEGMTKAEARKVQEYETCTYYQVHYWGCRGVPSETPAMPPKYATMKRIMETLTDEEERQVRDFIGTCRTKKCNNHAGMHGYCETHHKAIYQIKFKYADHWERIEALRNYPLTRK